LRLLNVQKIVVLVLDLDDRHGGVLGQGHARVGVGRGQEHPGVVLVDLLHVLVVEEHARRDVGALLVARDGARHLRLKVPEKAEIAVDALLGVGGHFVLVSVDVGRRHFVHPAAHVGPQANQVHADLGQPAGLEVDFGVIGAPGLFGPERGAVDAPELDGLPGLLEDEAAMVVLHPSVLPRALLVQEAQVHQGIAGERITRRLEGEKAFVNERRRPRVGLSLGRGGANGQQCRGKQHEAQLCRDRETVGASHRKSPLSRFFYRFVPSRLPFAPWATISPEQRRRRSSSAFPSLGSPAPSVP
jgi:hypothetical protein